MADITPNCIVPSPEIPANGDVFFIAGAQGKC